MQGVKESSGSTQEMSKAPPLAELCQEVTNPVKRERPHHKPLMAMIKKLKMMMPMPQTRSKSSILAEGAPVWDPGPISTNSQRKQQVPKLST